MPHRLQILKEELEKHVQGIESIALSQGSILNSWIRELSIKQADGTEKKFLPINAV